MPEVKNQVIENLLESQTLDLFIEKKVLKKTQDLWKKNKWIAWIIGTMIVVIAGFFGYKTWCIDENFDKLLVKWEKSTEEVEKRKNELISQVDDAKKNTDFQKEISTERNLIYKENSNLLRNIANQLSGDAENLTNRLKGLSKKMDELHDSTEKIKKADDELKEIRKLKDKYSEEMNKLPGKLEKEILTQTTNKIDPLIEQQKEEFEKIKNDINKEKEKLKNLSEMRIGPIHRFYLVEKKQETLNLSFGNIKIKRNKNGEVEIQIDNRDKETFKNLLENDFFSVGESPYLFKFANISDVSITVFVYLKLDDLVKS